ncbi:MAG: TonB-dependent receptor [Gammaproteobacteria bacterium]|jgi:hypothetical protein|nr:TonB-dependent receptor [Gammaproteobacteria bacterium]
MSFDRKYLVWGMCYLICGMSLGIYMAASNNHGQHPTHAHINLVGFAVSLIYATIHKLWLGDNPPKLAGIQFILHQAGTLVMIAGLLLLFGGTYPPATLEPFLSGASITVLVAAILMLVMVLKALRK